MHKSHRAHRSDGYSASTFDGESAGYYGGDKRHHRSSSYDNTHHSRSSNHSPHSHHRGSRSYSADRHHHHHHHQPQSDRTHTYREKERPIRSSHNSLQSNKKLQHATHAALDAAVVEAIRVRHEPGKWAGDKGARVATAAIGAAAVDMVIDKNPNKHGKRTLLESTLGGLIANRLANGRRDERRHRSF